MDSKVGKKARKIKSKVKQNSTKLVVLLIIVLMVFSALAVGIDSLFPKQSSNHTHVGVLAGNDVFKISDHEYYISYPDQEVHFRANPLEALNVTIKDKHGMHNEAYLSSATLFTSGSIILINPNSTAHTITAASELAIALGALKSLGFGIGNMETVFTEPSQSRPDVRVLDVTTAVNESVERNKAVFYLVGPDEGATETAIYTLGNPSRLLVLSGKTYDDLDLVCARIKLFLFSIRNR